MNMFGSRLGVTYVTAMVGLASVLGLEPARAQVPPEQVPDDVVAAQQGSKGEVAANAPTDGATDEGAMTAKSGSEAPVSSTPPRLLVHLTLTQTALTKEAILRALDDEFDVPVQATPQAEGLKIAVENRELVMSYDESPESTIERTMELPLDEDAQLSTIALLAGSLARDEAGALIAELKAQGEASEVPPPPLPDPIGPSEARSSAESSLNFDTASPAPESAPGEGKNAGTAADATSVEAAQEDDAAGEDAESGDDVSPASDDLPHAYASASIFGPVSFPSELHRKKTYAEIGLIYADIGSLEGGAFSMFVLRNRGIAPNGAGFGLQASMISTLNQGDFTGGVMSLLVASSRGRVEGGVAGGLVSLQRGTLEGGQGAGLVAYSRGKLTGAQLSMVSSTIQGELWGVQGSALVSVVRGQTTGAQLAGLVSVTSGTMEGLQLGTLGSVATKSMDGAQLGLVNVTPRLSGFQLGVVNAAYRQMDGVQVGLVNVAGDFRGTQVGIVNIGAHGHGTHVGLLNVASDMEGASLAPINIIPGVRNQLVVGASYAPGPNVEGIAAGPLYQLGLKFLPDPVYTQVGVGFGPEAEECVDDGAGGEECFGGGVVVSPAFSLGLRATFSPLVYGEFDLSYQYERGFNDSRSARHGALGRAAVGFQLTPAVALFAGGGPRVDFREGPRVESPPRIAVGGHAFAGAAFF